MKNASWLFKKYPSIGHKLQPGEISNGTYQVGDVLESIFLNFAPHWHRLPYGLGKSLEGQKSFRQWRAGTFDAEKWNGDLNANEEILGVEDCLCSWASHYDLMLPGHYLGTNEGNGSAFGIWWDRHFDGPVFKEHPEQKQPEPYYVVNERGNVSYHTQTGKEIFSYV